MMLAVVWVIYGNIISLYVFYMFVNYYCKMWDDIRFNEYVNVVIYFNLIILKHLKVNV